MIKIKDLEAIVLKLRKKNVKVTPQRLSVIDFLSNNPIHPSAEKIYTEIKKNFPTISLATVYNTLEKLEEIGELIKLKVAKDNIINYEYNLDPHQHFYCKQCDQIYDIWGTGIKKKDIVDGHKIENVQIYYKGICNQCTA